MCKRLDYYNLKATLAYVDSVFSYCFEYRIETRGLLIGFIHIKSKKAVSLYKLTVKHSFSTLLTSVQ